MADVRERQEYSLQGLYFYLTEGCNLRCRHCWIGPKYQKNAETTSCLPIRLFADVVEQGLPLGLSTIKLTGGEPFLHPEINCILEAVGQVPADLVVETNGVLCTERIVTLLAECRNAFVSVSVDGAVAETHDWLRQVDGSFAAARSAIRLLTKANIRTQVVFTLVRRNHLEIPAMVNLCDDLEVESVKFNVLQPIARGEHLYDRGEALSVQEILRLGDWVVRELASQTDMRLLFDYPAAFHPLSRLFGEQACHPGNCNILGMLGVLSTGDYALCGIGANVPDLVFGHASHKRLVEVWRDSAVLNELRWGLPHRLRGICGSCLMVERCFGSCIAQNYYSKRDLWASYWFCEEADQAGLFPESRRRPQRPSDDDLPRRKMTPDS